MDNEQIYYRTIPPVKLIRYIILVILGVFVLTALTTSFYTVATDEKGVVTRFGKFDRITEPGLHFKLPAPIELVQQPQVERIFKEEFGFKTLQAGVQSKFGAKNFDESLMLCGDLSVAQVEWIVQYKISEADKFLFNIRNPRKMIRDVSEAVMRNVVGDSSVDEVLTSRRAEINIQVKERMQQILKLYQSGIQITDVILQEVNAPDLVKPAFDDVNAAEQDKDRYINTAREDYNKVIPKARGEAKQVIKQAEAYAIDRTNTALGDANRFLQTWTEYKNSKDVTRRRLYLESMNRILPKLEKKYIIDSDVKGLLPLMNIGEGK
ncbi:MAG: FtsH protease activity modulator HflK [Planctomycetes bacterium]|nr:FtsH protease activity modulator HflK [Planctomycetota bacterium]